tara:strand:+ start:83 stop:913 length:831 start_codon:yes stop_codon:yes gene_type:complete
VKTYFLSLDRRQLLKVVVYSLLLINFAQYIRNDWVIAGHTLHSGSTFLDWTRAYAVTLDESAWIMLLILFELETYLINNPLSRAKAMLMLIVRLCCYGFLAHTLYAYIFYAYELSQAQIIDSVSNLCELVSRDVSYAYNLVYTEVTADNCANLSSASQFLYIDPPTFFIVQDPLGLRIEKQLIWVDIVEAITWLLILATIEVTVYLQDRGIVRGLLLRTVNNAKFFLYSILWCAIFYWIYRGHYMFAWDEFVWMVGFIAIEINVVEWRKEINQSEA